MITITFTPTEYDTDAVTVKAETFSGAICKLLDVLSVHFCPPEPYWWNVIFEALAELTDEDSDNYAKRVSHWDMSCPEDGFIIEVKET